jgi:hypothetical protein
MKRYTIYFAAILTIFIKMTTVAVAQGGDQILDGIGRQAWWPAMSLMGILRIGRAMDYMVNSRAQKLHLYQISNLQRCFLLLEEGRFVVLPAQVLADLESISITGWIYLRAAQSGQYLFDFGQDITRHFAGTPTGTALQNGYMGIIAQKKAAVKNAVSSAVPLNKWVHLAIVVDIATGTMQTYLDGMPAGEVKDIPQELTEVFGQQVARGHYTLENRCRVAM